MPEWLLTILLSPFLLLFAWLGSLAIGIAYFEAADPSAGTIARVVASMYAPAVALLFAVWVTAAILGRLQSADARLTYQLSFLLPVALAAYSIARYPGPQRLHLILVPIATVCAIFVFGWGFVLTFGK